MSISRLIGTGSAAAAAAWLLASVGAAPAEVGAAARSPQALVDTVGPDALLLAAATAAAWLVWAWGVLGLVLTLASAVPGAAGAGAGVALRMLLPAGARRAAAVLLGISLATAGPALLAGPALGTPGWHTVAATTDGVGTPPGDTSTVPGRGAGDAPAVPDWPPTDAPVTVPDWPERDAGAHVVLRGDCLWDIAGAWLQGRDGVPPTEAAVAAAVQDWWTANARVIGPDPDVLLPGQVLVPPG